MNLEDTLHEDLSQLSADVHGGPDLQRAISAGRANRRRRHVAQGVGAGAAAVALTVGSLAVPALLDSEPGGASGPGVSASCAVAIRFHGTYFFRAKPYVVGGPAIIGPPVGTAVFPLTCNDTGIRDPQRFSKPFTVYRIQGVDPRDAVIGPSQGQGPRPRTVYKRPSE